MIEGNANNPPIVKTSATKNGPHPRKTSCKGISGLTPDTTKQFNPIGGVIRHNSAILNH